MAYHHSPTALHKKSYLCVVAASRLCSTLHSDSVPAFEELESQILQIRGYVDELDRLIHQSDFW